MKTVHSPISSDPYSDDRNDDLCYSFRSEHNVIQRKAVTCTTSQATKIHIQFFSLKFQLHFHIHRYMIDKSDVPPHIPNGMIRIEAAFELDDSFIVGMALVIRTERNSESTNKIAMF